MVNSTSQQPLGEFKVYVEYTENFGLITVCACSVAGCEIPMACFSPEQLELWRVDIQIEVETEERLHLEFENRVE